jgi:Ca2+-binding RTX toxin-like protein
MTTIKLSKSLLETDLSGLLTPANIRNKLDSIYNDLKNDVTFNEQELENGTLKNPTFTGKVGEYKTNGYVAYKINSDEDVSMSSSFKSAKITTDEGIISLVGAFSNNSNFNGNYSSSQKLTKISYIGEDGSKWSVSGGYNLSYKYIEINGKYSYNYAENFQSFTSIDSKKNSVSFIGNILAKSKQPDDEPVFSGCISEIKLNLDGIKINSTGLNFSYDDVMSFELRNVKDLLPQLLNGNDVITISSEDPINEINGYLGNDKISCSNEDNSIIGGVGSDTLTGGKGADTFIFSTADFFSENSVGNPIYNKSLDIVTDFSIIDGDKLIVNDGDIYTFFKTLNEAKIDKIEGFFAITAESRIYYGITDINKNYTVIPVITLTGKNIFNSDGTGWADVETEVSANIKDQLIYANTVLENNKEPICPSFYVDDFFKNLSSLEWNSPLYDDTKRMYDLSFKSSKKLDTLAGTYSIKHISIGDDVHSYDGASTGKLSDTIIASYGTEDKLTISQNRIGESKVNGYSYLSDFLEVFQSTNDTPNDKNDDYLHTISLSTSHIDTYTALTENTKGTDIDKYKDAYKSKNLNYLIDSERTINSSNGKFEVSFNSQEKYNAIYSNSDIVSDVKTNAEVSYVELISEFHSGDGIDILSKCSISKAKLLITSLSNIDDNVSINFTGNYDFKENYGSKVDSFGNLSVKKLEITTSDVLFSSKGFSNVNVLNNFTALNDIINIASNFSKDNISPINTANLFISIAKKGDDTFNIKKDDGYFIDAEDGNDIVVGKNGADTIIGGVGSDTLTGGKGADTFIFSTADFFSENSVGNPIYNKSLDIVTDFSKAEGDKLIVNDREIYNFFKTMAEVKTDKVEGFFVITGESKIYYGITDTNKNYTVIPLITLTGKNIFNIDGTGWVDTSAL